MNRPVFRNNPAYVEYMARLLDLHRLIRDGAGDSEEADATRDRMDHPWYRLSDDEIARVDELSADLNTLEPDSPILHPQGGGFLSDESRGEFDSLLLNEDWRGIIGFLRDRASTVSADLAAYYRGRCWTELGEHEAAIEFLRYAAERRPDCAPVLIHLLVRTDRLREARTRALQLLPVADSLIPNNAFTLANCCGMIAARLSPPERNRWLEHSVDLFERTFARANELRDRGIETEVIPGEFAALGLAYLVLGNPEKARWNSDKALELEPDNPNAKMLHGLVLQGWRPDDGSEEASWEVASGLLDALAERNFPPPLAPALLAA